MNGVYKIKSVYSDLSEIEAEAKHEEMHRAKMDRMREHKNAYMQQELEKQLREKHPGLQEAYERYQTILKLVNND